MSQSGFQSLPFDIGQLRYAIAAADHGSIYRAARAMGVAQSTLSRKIPKLEHAIGAKIFQRSRGGVTTTFIGDHATMMGWQDAYPDVQLECVKGNRGALLSDLDAGEVYVAVLMGRTVTKVFAASNFGASGCS